MKNTKIISSVLATALVTTTGVIVQAEEVPSVAPEAAGTTTIENIQTVVPTEQEVNNAKIELAAATSAVNAQENVVNNQQVEVNQEAMAVSSAKEELTTAQKIADNSTEENIVSATTAVTDSENNISHIEQAISEAQETVEQQEAAVVAQETVVTEKQQIVTKKQADVTTAQEIVNVAQVNLDGTGASHVVAEQERAQKNVVIAETDVIAAQNELVTALENDEKRAVEISAAEKEVDTATKQVSETGTTLEAAKLTSAETQAILSSATASFETAKADFESINTIYVSDEYVQALKNYELGLKGQYDRAAAITVLKSLNANLRTANKYKSNSNDKLVSIADVNNLSTEIIQELSLFGSDLINQIRVKFGTPTTSVTTSSIQVADMVTDIYVSDNYGWNRIVESSHNDNALDTVGEKLHVSVGENLNTWNRTTTSTTLDHLKSLVYQSMVEFLYNGREWLHARSIAGLDDTSSQESYIGVDISSIAGATSVHVNDVDSNALFTGNTFNTTAITNPENSSTIRANYETAQTTYKQAVTNNQVAQTTLLKANTAYETAKEQLISAESKLALAIATVEQAPAASIKLTTAQETLVSAKSDLELANKAVANLNASIQEKQALLATAKSVLNEKELELDSTKAELVAEITKLNGLKERVRSTKETIATLEKQLATEKQLLSDAKQYLTNLQNAPALLAAAQTKFDKANSSLTSKYEKLQSEKAILEKLKDSHVIANKTYRKLLDAYNAYLSELTEKELMERLDNEYKAIVENSGSPVPVVDGNGKIVGFVDANKEEVISGPSQKSPVAVPPKVSLTIQNANSVEKENALPKTGEVKSSLFVLGLTLLGLSSLGLAGKRHKKQ
ncbi:TPA: SEC10/PgrA surface exclusion domain-containing protein [Streptococcus suis]